MHHRLAGIWKVEQDGVWDARRLDHVWKAERAGVWGAHRLLAVGDVAFDGGPERWLLEMGDVADVVPPHPSTRGGAVLVLKYRKVTRPGIEPRTFWTYTRCSNQLSYLALEFNQLILYLCNCQPKDTYSVRHIQCHSLHARSTCDHDMTRLVNLETM